MHTYLGCPAVQSYTIGRMVGRMHIGEDVLTVVRYVISRFLKKRKGFLKQPRNERRFIIAAAIQCHKENRCEYRSVMSGRFDEEFVPMYFIDQKTKDILIARPIMDSDMTATA